MTTLTPAFARHRDRRLPEFTLYRAVQEALTNAGPSDWVRVALCAALMALQLTAAVRARLSRPITARVPAAVAPSRTRT